MRRQSVDAETGGDVARFRRGGQLAASSRSAADITTVFLTGGTSAVPAVKHLLALLLPKARAIEGDLFNSVGFGLALEAKRRVAR